MSLPLAITPENFGSVGFDEVIEYLHDFVEKMLSLKVIGFVGKIQRIVLKQGLDFG